MKTKFIKSLIVTVLALSLLFCSAVTAFALPINNVTNSYFYNVDGKDAAAPDAFTVVRVLDYSDITGGTADLKFQPRDMFVYEDLLFIVDSETSQVHILDINTFEPAYKPVGGKLSPAEGYAIPPVVLSTVSAPSDEEDEEGLESEAPATGAVSTGNPTAFVQPEGIFVIDSGEDKDEDGMNDPILYVADTGNQRIVVCDVYGTVSNVYQNIKAPILGDNYAFLPTRLVIDNTKDIQVICRGETRGIMQIESDGNFRGFFGAPDVIISLWNRIWRNFATEEQLAKMENFTPTEYSSVAIDSRGFVYPTIAALDEGAIVQLKNHSIATTYAPLKKLSADGTDMLRRKGLAAPMGDLVWSPHPDYSPKLVDVVVDDSFRYTLLDQQTGRFFTYDEDGNILYLGGGAGSARGQFTLATCIEVYEDYYFVGDTSTTTATGTVTVFRTTDYAKAINTAVETASNGEWEASIPLWEDVLKYNSNMYIANIGLGKAEMRLAMSLVDGEKDQYGMTSLDHYEKAVEYFDRASEKDNYSIAYTALRTNEMEKYFGLIFGGFAVLIVGLLVLSSVTKYRKARKVKMAERAAKKLRPERQTPTYQKMKTPVEASAEESAQPEQAEATAEPAEEKTEKGDEQ